MERFLDLTGIVCLCISIFCLVIYLPRIKGWFGAIKPQKKLVCEKKNKFAVLIPAKNEGKIIEDILRSLAAQTYPREYFDIHVIVKEKNDITIQKTEQYGGYAYVAENQKCKGDALDFCMKSILKNRADEYDAFFIVDADCLLEPTCMEEINNAMASGADVIQAKKIVKNYLSKNKNANSLASSCNGIIWTLIDDMGNRYKSDKGITNMTIGTGLLLTNSLVKRLGGWPYKQTLTEDMELMNDCAVKGYKTFYYSYAKIYVEESTSLRVTNIRRTRWLTGLIDSKRIYNERLNTVAAEGGKKRRDVYFVKALWPVYYYIGTLTIAALVWLAMFGILAFMHSPAAIKALLYSSLAVAAIYASFFVMTFCAMIVDRKNIKLPFYKKIALLFAHPIFYMGYIPIITKALLNKSADTWIAIERMDFGGDMGFEEEEENECYKAGCPK